MKELEKMTKFLEGRRLFDIVYKPRQISVKITCMFLAFPSLCPVRSEVSYFSWSLKKSGSIKMW